MVDLIDCSQLLYNNKEGGEGNLDSKTADSNTAKEQQYVCNKDPVIRRTPISNEHVYNIQILYNINQALDPEL